MAVVAGRGNIRFATPRNPTPEIAENGEPGEERELQLELEDFWLMLVWLVSICW